MDAPIPTPRLDDDEDVHWALSTAGALWGRGEKVEALKWLRRAAEQASDVNADTRALELFKAAADVASKVGPLSNPPPAPKPPAPPPSAMGETPKPLPPASAMGETPRPSAAPPPPASAQSPRTPPPPPPRRAAEPSVPALDAQKPARPPPPPPPRPGSVYPPPPVAQRVSSVPPVPAPPALSPPPAQPRAPSIPQIAAAPAAAAPPVPAARPPKSPVLQSTSGESPKLAPPAIVPPARAVAITSAKASAAAPAVVPPKRRRSFTGESRAVAEKARTSEPARAPHRARRRTFEDEAARQAPGVPLGPVMMMEKPAGPDPASIFDDLEEDTRVLQTKPGGGTDDVIDQAFERLRTGNGGHHDAPAATHSARPAGVGEARKPSGTGSPSSASQPAGSAAKAATPPSRPAAAPQASAHDELTDDGDEPSNGPPSAQTKVWNQIPDMEGPGPATERPSSIPDAAPARPRRGTAAKAPPKPVHTLPALRVAVLATSVPGEVRLIALEPSDEPPPGAALAVLVPLSAADGESVTKLFGGLE